MELASVLPTVFCACIYRDDKLLLRLDSSYQLKSFVEEVCSRMKILDPTSVSFRFGIAGFFNFYLQIERDFTNMMALITEGKHTLVSVHVSDTSISKSVGECSSSSSGVLNSGIGESEPDLLLSYCPTKVKRLKSAKWANLITGVGQCFYEGVVEVRRKLMLYAAKKGFEYNLDKNDSTRLTATCKKKKEQGCLWRIHVSVTKENGFFYTRSFHDEHKCDVGFVTSKVARINSEIVGILVADNVRGRSIRGPIDVLRFCNDEFGINVSYHVAWWAFEHAKYAVFGNFTASFDKLNWYVDAAKDSNPGSHFDLQCLPDGRFKRVFVAFRACIAGFNYCRPLLFLDATHLKGRYKGTLFGATAKNGNQGLYPVAFAVVSDGETDDNWLWFFENLRKIIVEDCPITFISDRNNGLLKGVPRVFPNGFHSYCLYHLRCNLRDRVFAKCKEDFKERLDLLLRSLIAAPTKSLFDQRLSLFLKDGGRRVKKFLDDLPFENLCNAHFRGQRYGEMTSNVAESFNNWIKEEREMPITLLIDNIKVKMMDMMSRLREESSNWNSGICPKMREELLVSLQNGRSWKVFTSSPTCFEVHFSENVLVDVANRTCSCYQWQLNGFPCAHAVTVIQKRSWKLEDYVDPYFQTTCFLGSYADYIYTVCTLEKCDMIESAVKVLPPKVKAQSGRPKKKRFRSVAEIGKTIRCSNCKKFGHHNRAVCNGLPND